MKKLLKKLGKGEEGQALFTVLILLLVGGLIIAPLLGYISTGLISGEVYEQRMGRVYAADSGMEDALWKIKSDNISAWMKGTWDDAVYNHVPPSENYTFASPVNGHDVAVSLQPTWVLDGLETPIGGKTSPDELIISGATIDPGAGYYQIKIVYDGTLGAVQINKIGMWLPAGFTYVSMVTAQSDLDAAPSGNNDFRGGKEIWWDTSSNIDFNFPAGSITTKVVVFQFSPSGIPQATFSWVRSSSLLSWDADLKIFKITSTATHPITGKQTTVEAYTAKNELRKQASAVGGDYFAIGNTLMTPSVTTGEGRKYRDLLFQESSATIITDNTSVAGIPSIALVEAAWLYWSGWIEEASGITLWSDDVSTGDNWTWGSAWSISSGRFRGHLSGGHSFDNPDRHLTMNPGTVDLSAYQGLGQTVTISWDQSTGGFCESEDRLWYELSADGNFPGGGWFEAFRGSNPSSPFTCPIPDSYLTDQFRIRFFLSHFDDGWIFREYCYIDNIRISVVVDPVEAAKVNRALFTIADNVTQVTVVNNPPNSYYQTEATADSGAPDSWSYSCFWDATDLVKQLIAEGKLGTNGSGTYTLGHWLESGADSYDLHEPQSPYSVTATTGYPLATPAAYYGGAYQWTYAGWSLIIVYTSPATRGHQLYVFDDFHYIGLNTLLQFPISGFLAPDDPTGSHLTYFVGEGDNHYTSDYIEVNNLRLPRPGDPYEPYAGFNPQNNVFNSYSNSLDDPYLSGVDIDTFDMSSCISPGDSTADIELDNGQEIYNLVYIILSFSSDISTGGPLTYIVRE